MTRIYSGVGILKFEAHSSKQRVSHDTGEKTRQLIGSSLMRGEIYLKATKKSVLFFSLPKSTLWRRVDEFPLPFVQCYK